MHLLALCIAIAAAPRPYEADGKWGYFAPEREVPVVRPAYDWAEEFSDGVGIVGLGKKVGWVTSAGKVTWLKPESLTVKSAGKCTVGGLQLDAFVDGCAHVAMTCEAGDYGGTNGFVDKAGFVRDDACAWGQDGLIPAWARLDTGKAGFVDKAGKLVIPMKFVDAQPFSEGLAWVVEKGQQWGAIDTKGAWVIPPRYAAAARFSEGLAAVQADGVWGFVDTSGKVVIAPAFENVWSFKQGFAAVKKGGKWSFVDKTGQPGAGGGFDELSARVGGTTAAKTGSTWGLVDATGKTVLAPTYGGLWPSGENWLAAPDASKREFVLINSAGKRLGPATLVSEVRPMRDGSIAFADAKVASSNTWGIIASDGAVIVPASYSAIGEPSEGLIAVARTEGDYSKWGFIDGTGKVVIPIEYAEARQFSCGLAAVRKGNWGFIDKTGKAKTRFRFFEASSHVDCYAHVLTEIDPDNRPGQQHHPKTSDFIDRDGKRVIASGVDDRPPKE